MIGRHKPRQAAEQVHAYHPIRPTTLIPYHSDGNLLAIGRAARLAGLSKHTLPGLSIFRLICSEEPCSPDVETRFPSLASASDVKVRGHLGAFRVEATINGVSVDVNRTLLRDAAFDLILDLQDVPAITLPVPPLGYRVAGSGPMEEFLAELAELVGDFEKPKFFEVRPEICAHSASDIKGCRACLDVCGAGAIRSENQKISVDPHLCQGCGDCTTVCPAGAINYLYPRRGDSLARLRAMLDAWFRADGDPPILLLYDAEAGANCEVLWADHRSDHFLPYPLEALGAVGLDFWLNALAYGCSAVGLLVLSELSRQTISALKTQLCHAETLLTGLGYPAGLIRLIRPHELTRLDQEDGVRVPPARHGGDDDKRTAIRQALAHLHKHAPSQPDVLNLGEGAPFGEVRVDPARCTLCMACVSICPEAALSAGDDEPRLGFIEANCVQCGLCRNACPEAAITLHPRYRFDAVDARRSRVLHREEVFRCITCGKPFANAAMIRTITQRLRGHPMFQGDRHRHLKMCDECRVKTLFSG